MVGAKSGRSHTIVSLTFKYYDIQMYNLGHSRSFLNFHKLHVGPIEICQTAHYCRPVIPFS